MQNILFKNRKGNALLLAILVLLVLGALGISQLVSMITGARQSQVLFKGIDANFLLEGMIQEAESRIRGEANDYAKAPHWFNVFRNTDEKGTSAWKEVSMNGSKINVLAKEVDAELKVIARFIGQGPHRRDGRKDGERVNFGKEKIGQLEIKAQAKIGNDYYHAHAAKDVKVVNPLCMSYNGNFNLINDYTMFIKFAMQEYQVEYPFRVNGEKKTDPTIRFGNYLYNRYVDERTDDLSNDFYFVRLMNGGKSTVNGKVYLGSPKDMRSSKYKILIDLPRGGYGGFYEMELGKKIYTLGDPDTKEYTKKKKTLYSAKIIKKKEGGSDKDYNLVKSVLGETILKRNYQKLHDAGIKKADNPSTPGSEEAMRVGAGEWMKNAGPVEIFRTIDGWEYSSFPWRVNLETDTPGKAKKKMEDGKLKFTVISPDDWAEKVYVGLNPYTWDSRVITKQVENILKSMKNGIMEDMKKNSPTEESNINIAQPFLIGSTYMTYFLRSPDNLMHYNSVSHSSFISDKILDMRNDLNDYTNDGYRGHPVLQLNGTWKNGKWMSETQVEGNVYARYMEGYYMRFKNTAEGDTYEVDVNYDALDTHEVAEIQKDLEENNDEMTAEEKFKRLIETSCDGPELRYNNADNYNTVAKFVPYNRDGIIPPSSVTTPYNNGISDVDFANIYLDKITALYVDYRDFSHHNIKVEDDTMHLYLNGIYLINSAFPMPISDGVKKMVYHGKGAILVAGDIQIKKDLLRGSDNDLLILATIGKRDGDSLKNSFIRVDGGTDKQYIRVEASLYALNRDYYDEGHNMGLNAPCFISFAFGTQVYGNWVADWMYYYPGGTQEKGGSYVNNKALRGTLLEYDRRLHDRDEGNIKNYLADIAQPYAFWMVWKNKDSEI